MADHYDRCLHGASRGIRCVYCELDAVRARLHALEQNTVPSGSAKQKPHEWTLSVWRFPGSAIWNVGPRGISTPEPTEHKTVRVREVLDD